jgi:uncharacterized membrane protein
MKTIFLVCWVLFLTPLTHVKQQSNLLNLPELSNTDKPTKSTTPTTPTQAPSALQDAAFEVLSLKCNSCHSKINRRRLFTKTNMNTWSEDVYTQVFVKKRMPKGKKNQLTLQEKQQLINWIYSLKQ